MIEYDKESMTMDIFCDGRGDEKCDEVVAYYGTWSECIAQSKDDGWISFKDESSGEWVHRCLDCKRPRVDEMFKD